MKPDEVERTLELVTVTGSVKSLVKADDAERMLEVVTVTVGVKISVLVVAWFFRVYVA